MVLLSALKQLWWELRERQGRFNHLATFLREIPGNYGQILRGHWLGPYFASFGDGVRIYQGARFRNPQCIHLADGVEVGVDCFLQGSGGITLGKRVMLGPGTKIWSANHKFDRIDVPIQEQGYEFAPVEIADGCWLGANVIVLPGVVLPEGCVVSAGSILGIKRYPMNSLIAGAPARVIGIRGTHALKNDESADRAVDPEPQSE